MEGKSQERKKERNQFQWKLTVLFLLLLFWSFPKYQYINKHEKQLVIHKAFGNSVVIKANWSGSTNAGDGNKFSGLDRFEWLEIAEVPEAAASRAVQLAAALSSACRKRQEYYKFPAQSELFQSPVTTSLVKWNTCRKPLTTRRFFPVPSLLLFSNKTHLPRIKILISNNHSAVILEQKFHKSKGNAMEQ